MIDADGALYWLGPLVLNGSTIFSPSGAGSLEITQGSTLELNAPTSEALQTGLGSVPQPTGYPAPIPTTTLILDQPATFTGSVDIDAGTTLTLDLPAGDIINASTVTGTTLTLDTSDGTESWTLAGTGYTTEVAASGGTNTAGEVLIGNGATLPSVQSTQPTQPSQPTEPTQPLQPGTGSDAGTGNDNDNGSGGGMPTSPTDSTQTPTFTGEDMTTGTPITGYESFFADYTSDSIQLNTSVANPFIVSGLGDDIIQASGPGTNVLDDTGGMVNFEIGSTSGNNAFFLDASKNPVTWNTIANFHAGDFAVIYGIGPQDLSAHAQDNWGVPGFQGLTLETYQNGGAAFVTFAGLSTADLGTTIVTGAGVVNGAPYLLVEGR